MTVQLGEGRPVLDTGPEAGLHHRVGLIVGVLVFAGLLAAPVPAGLSVDGWRTAAVGTLMAVWWISEAVPLPATALLPIVLFPALGVLEVEQATSPYANELIFLFMGGFFIASAMQRSNLHRRLALAVVAAVGTGPERLIFGFMLATALLSMWISNSATAAMMLPIAIAVGEMFRPAGAVTYNFGIALMLGIAYGASIGGIATLIGTPPNAVFAAAAGELLRVEIGFFEWMLVGVPLAAILLPLTWILLVRVLFPLSALSGDAGELLRTERDLLGPMARAEKVVLGVFVLTALAWIMRAPKPVGAFTIPGLTTYVPGIEDSTIAMAAALVLFVLPIGWKRQVFALDWESAARIPWGVLLLFGGGLALARAMAQSGLAAWIGGAIGQAGAWPEVVIVLAVTTLFVFLTEVTSNTATAAMAMPVMFAVGQTVGVEPLLLMGAAALSASMAFMLPVATPPNAIVFGSGYLAVPHMMRAGWWVNLAAIVLITFVAVPLLAWVML